jgi:hypothetical protein
VLKRISARSSTCSSNVRAGPADDCGGRPASQRSFSRCGRRVPGARPSADGPEKRPELQPAAKLLQGGAEECAPAADFGAEVRPDRSIMNLCPAAKSGTSRFMQDRPSSSGRSG